MPVPVGAFAYYNGFLFLLVHTDIIARKITTETELLVSVYFAE